MKLIEENKNIAINDPEKAREIARRSGMAKGIAGADESDSE
jgi:hypothetical protein